MESATSVTLDNYVDLGWLTRSRLPSAKVKKLVGKGLPEAANFEYHISERSTSKKESTEQCEQFTKKIELEQVVWQHLATLKIYTFYFFMQVQGFVRFQAP